MFLYVDNFLPDELFMQLNKQMLWRFRPNVRQDNKSESPMRIRTLSENNDYTESKMLLGKMVPDAINLVKNHMVNVLKFKNPEAHSIWYQYMLPKHFVGKHHDYNTIRDKKPYQCFSAFLYTHGEWQDDWGGELCFNGAELLPKSNRIIMYSRDEEHWVNPIKHGNETYNRMFLGISWSTDNDFQ